MCVCTMIFPSMPKVLHVCPMALSGHYMASFIPEVSHLSFKISDSHTLLFRTRCFQVNCITFSTVFCSFCCSSFGVANSAGTFKDLSHQGVKILPQRVGFAFILFVLRQQCQREAFAYCMLSLDMYVPLIESGLKQSQNWFWLTLSKMLWFGLSRQDQWHFY